jgi:hypothetical protein
MKTQLRIFKRFALTALPLVTLVGSLTSAAGTKWVPFSSDTLHVQVAVPDDWSPVKTPNALAFRFDDLVGGSAAFGILKSDASGMHIDEAVDKEFAQKDRPADWQRSNSKIDGMRAIKIAGSSKSAPENKMVHYFVETPRGIYLIQCQATQEQWSVYSPIFATILSKLKFLP